MGELMGFGVGLPGEPHRSEGLAETDGFEPSMHVFARMLP